MSRVKSKKVKKIDFENKREFKITEIILIFLFIFSFSFMVSFSLTKEKIYLAQAISAEDEANNLSIVLGENDLNNLYKRDVSIFKELEQDRKSGKNPVLILGYHQVREFNKTDGPKTKLFIITPEIFEKEMRYLSENGYQTIYLADYIKYLNSSTADNNFLPKKSVVITFDDGYASQYSTALPILKKYNFIATFFIYKNCIDIFPVCMTSQELFSLANNSMKLANHTLDHVFLPNYSEEEIKREISENQNWLLKTFGSNNVENVFAYPYGAQNQNIKYTLKGLGYSGAVGVKGGYEKDKTNIFDLHRYLFGNDYSDFEAIVKN